MDAPDVRWCFCRLCPAQKRSRTRVSGSGQPLATGHGDSVGPSAPPLPRELRTSERIKYPEVYSDSQDITGSSRQQAGAAISRRLGLLDRSSVVLLSYRSGCSLDILLWCMAT